MNKSRISVIALAIGLGFSVSAMAQTMSKGHYQSGKDSIAAAYKFDKAACGTLSGNAKDICNAEAGGREKVAKAELKAKYQPSVGTSYKARVARADADYAVAREECDDRAGNVKDVCVKEAMAAAVAVKADARAWMKTVDVNVAAAGTSAKANSAASAKGADARRHAASEKNDADYDVAKEKCDDFAGDAKGECINRAKVRFGKS